MEYLFTPNNLKVLESYALVKTLYAFDFDGTLAAIADKPGAARLTPEVSDMLIKLNNVVPLAIITGRSRADILKLLPFEPKILIGNHGIEGSHHVEELEAMRSQCEQWTKLLQAYLHTYLQSESLCLENKSYSLTLHYRSFEDKNLARKIISTVLMKLPKARITEGKMVFNILPDTSFHKGQALEQILRQGNYKFGFYIGDDQTDEDVFGYRLTNLMTVKVGKDASLAKYYINDQSEVEILLRMLLKLSGH